MTHRYQVFGLVFESCERLPSLAGCEIAGDSRPTDVTVRKGQVSMPAQSELVEDDMHAAGTHDHLVFDVAESGTFSIRPDRIDYQPDPAATREQTHAYLLGSAMGALLHMRTLLPIHCNAIGIDGQLFLFCGDSGAGKSTLAAHFARQGHAVLTDDLCAVRRRDDGRFEGLPGIARLKLWQDALDMLDMPATDLPRIPWADDKFEVARSNTGTEPLPIRAIYLLSEAGEGAPAGIHALPTLGALEAVIGNIYRRRLADLCGHGGDYLTQAARLVSATPIFVANRHWGLDHFQQETRVLERHMRELAADACEVEPTVPEMHSPLPHRNNLD